MKALELQRRLRELADAARPQPSIDGLRQQAVQGSPIPRIDPRLQVPELRSTAAVRDLLTTISTLTGINITYDQVLATSQALNQAYSVDIRQMSLEDVLTQVMQANGLTFKVVNPQTIFVYQDTVPNRQKYEDQYTQTFYVSHVDPQADLLPILQQLLITGAPVPPRVSVNKSANSLSVRATAPMMLQIERLIKANDRPRPEVMIEAEVLEVNRNFIRKLGLDLSQFALGVTFSPELAPPNTGGVPDAFPAMPPPFNANTVSRGVSGSDFYITSPTALIRLLESNSTTRVLAKPQSRGRDGQQMTLSLGDSIPIPQTTFNSVAAGGVANVPTTSVTYQEVGINLQFTPRVTYQDEIILDSLVLEKSGLGNNLLVGGQLFPTIVRRRSQGSIRLRDGESNVLAGLLRDDDRKTLRGLPGISSIPLLRTLFGSTDDQVDQTDIIMIITPHIVRGHDLTPEDLRPQFVGAGQTVGGPTPPLISPEVILGTAPANGGQAALAPGQPVQPATPGAISVAPIPSARAEVPPVASRAPGVVPIEAVPSGAPVARATCRTSGADPADLVARGHVGGRRRASHRADHDFGRAATLGDYGDDYVQPVRASHADGHAGIVHVAGWRGANVCAPSGSERRPDRSRVRAAVRTSDGLGHRTAGRDCVRRGLTWHDRPDDQRNGDGGVRSISATRVHEHSARREVGKDGVMRAWLGRNSPGYTFIELIIATAVMMILASAALPLARVSIRRQKETYLRTELRSMRAAIDRFKDLADTGGIAATALRLGCENYPASLETLVEGVPRSNDASSRPVKFLRRVPLDPITGRADWGLRAYSDAPDATSWSGQCVFDVYSKAPGRALDGTRYRDW